MRLLTNFSTCCLGNEVEKCVQLHTSIRSSQSFYFFVITFGLEFPIKIQNPPFPTFSRSSRPHPVLRAQSTEQAKAFSIVAQDGDGELSPLWEVVELHPVLHHLRQLWGSGSRKTFRNLMRQAYANFDICTARLV